MSRRLGLQVSEYQQYQVIIRGNRRGKRDKRGEEGEGTRKETGEKTCSPRLTHHPTVTPPRPPQDASAEEEGEAFEGEQA